jgi:hypothetical protein
MIHVYVRIRAGHLIVTSNITGRHMLFEGKQRDARDSRTYIETEWVYLDRSGRVEATRVRDLLNGWFEDYPPDEQDELKARFTSRDPQGFDSAFFELALFTLLRTLGCSVQVHPELPGECTKRPDFLVTSPAGEEFYVEAVLASDYSQDEKAAQARVNVVLNAINGIDTPDFFLSIVAEGSPETPPRGRSLANELQAWLNSLDVDSVAQEASQVGLDSLPSMRWEHEGWQVEFRAIPKRIEARGAGQRPIGMMTGELRWINVWESIRDAIKAKGRRYGELELPLLVCVNADAISVDRTDEMDALFGQEEYVFNKNDLSAPPTPRRKRNGAWLGPKGPQYTRVGGAWLFQSIGPWNLASGRGTLYPNPWAQRPLPSLFDTVARAVPGEDGTMTWLDGPSLGELLDLPEHWPE